MISNSNQTSLAIRGKIAIIVWSLSFFAFFSPQEVDAFFIPEGGRILIALPPCHLPIPGSVWTLSINLATKLPHPELRFPVAPRAHYIPPLPITNTLGQALPIRLPCCWYIGIAIICNPVPGFLPAPPSLYGASF